MSLSEEQIQTMRTGERYWQLWESSQSFTVDHQDLARFIGERQVAQRYGTRVGIDQTTSDDKGNWTLQLRATFPRVIEDDLTGERIVRFLELPGIGRISMDTSGKILDSPKRQELAEIVSDRLVSWKNCIEAIVVNASARKLIKIPEVRVGMNKFAMILQQLDSKPTVPLTRLQDQVFPEGGDKMNKYLSLMEDLNLVRRDDGNITYGAVLQGLYERSSNGVSTRRSLEEIQELGLAYVLAERHGLLKDYLGLTTIDPFVNAETCIYRPSIEAQQSINLSEYKIEVEFLRTASPTSAYFRSYLDKLVQVKAITRVEDTIYAGVESLLKRMLDRSRQLGLSSMKFGMP